MIIIVMAAKESLVALLEDEDDDHFEERISGRLSFLVEEATKLSFELDKINFDAGANEAPANGLEPNKPMTVQNINDKLKSVQAKLELAEKLSSTPNNTRVRQAKQVAKQFDVSSWPYPKLRDMLNISSDLDLLMACHAEIERRVAARKAEQERILAKSTSNPRSNQVTYNRMPIWKQDEHSDATRHLAGWWYFQYDGDLKVMRQFKIFHPDLEELGRIAGGHWQTMVNQSDISLQDFESAWNYYQQNISIQGTQL